MAEEIGGYFSLELPARKLQTLPAFNGILLNTGRNSIEYILRSIEGITKVHIPYFTCDTVLEPINKLNLQYRFYSIDERFHLKEDIELKDGEYLIYTNYFGVMDQYVSQLDNKYKDKLIVDNAQALFAKPTAKCAYSPRKYVGIPDGGIAFSDGNQKVLNLDQSTSYDLCEHLLKRIDCGAETGYSTFRANSDALSMRPVERMSELTRHILATIDFDTVKRIRKENFNYLNEHLTAVNRLSIPSIDTFSCPMVYPYYCEDEKLRSILIQNKIFVATYWPNVFEWCRDDAVECNLAKYIIPLPIDQRYGIEDMNFMIKYLK